MRDRTIEGLETNLDAIAACVRSEDLPPFLKGAWPDMAEILTDAATQLRRLRKVFEEEPASEDTPEDADVKAILEKGDSVEILRDVVLHRLKWPPLDRESLSPWLLQLRAIVQRVIDLDTPEGAAHLTMTKSYLSGRRCCDFTIADDDTETHEEGCPWRIVDEFANRVLDHTLHSSIKWLENLVCELVEDITASPIRAPEGAAHPEHTKLIQRIGEAVGRIGKMCSEGRPPKMSIPVRPEDDDIFISETLVQCRDVLRGGPIGPWDEKTAARVLHDTITGEPSVWAKLTAEQRIAWMVDARNFRYALNGLDRQEGKETHG